MSDLEATIKGSAETAGLWEPDWDDVLARARGSRPRVSRRAAALGGIAAIALVLLVPGIGVGGSLKDLITGSRAPSIELRAELMRPDGVSIGSVTLRATRIFVAVDPRTGRAKPFWGPRGRGPALPPVPVRWTLDLQAGQARSARIVGTHAQVIARLCKPCSEGAQGIIRLRPRVLLELLGRATAVVETAGGPARGTLRLPAPVR